MGGNHRSTPFGQTPSRRCGCFSSRETRPSVPDRTSRPKVPLSKAIEQKLAHLAERASTPQRKVSLMQVAAQLLEESAARCDNNLQ